MTLWLVPQKSDTFRYSGHAFSRMRRFLYEYVQVLAQVYNIDQNWKRIEPIPPGTWCFWEILKGLIRNGNRPRGCCDIGGQPKSLQHLRDSQGHDMACAYMEILGIVPICDVDVRRIYFVLKKRAGISSTCCLEDVCWVWRCVTKTIAENTSDSICHALLIWQNSQMKKKVLRLLSPRPTTVNHFLAFSRPYLIFSHFPSIHSSRSFHSKKHSPFLRNLHKYIHSNKTTRHRRNPHPTVQSRYKIFVREE